MAWSDVADIEGQLQTASDVNDVGEMKRVCEQLLVRMAEEAQPFPLTSAKGILGNLRRKRQFGLMSRVADRLIRSNQQAPQVRRQYAQALIDRGDLSAAIPFLELLVRDTSGPGDRGENFEARGLLGRAYKQAYVDSAKVRPRSEPPLPRDCENLERSIEWYAGVWRSDSKEVWHGVNMAALLLRAQRDGVSLKDYADPSRASGDIASQIIQDIEQRWEGHAASLWDCATAAESHLVRGNPEDALVWLGRYVREPRADAFELAGTARQLREVWGLGGADDNSSLLAILDAEIARKGGDIVFQGDVTPRDDQAVTLQRVLGTTRFVTFQEYETGRERAMAVARIEDPSGNPVGTGFLVRGGDLLPSLGDDLVLLTNSHVVGVTKGDCVPPPLLLEEAIASFNLLPNPEQRKVEVIQRIWTSPPGMFDTTVLRLARVPEGVRYVPLLTPRLPLKDGTQRVYVVGHPNGQELSFSLQDNILLDHEGPHDGKPSNGIVKLHYRAPTEHGSSGSPVFNRAWGLIAIHHAGSMDMPKLNGVEGRHPANEGIWIQSVVEAIRRDLGG